MVTFSIFDRGLLIKRWSPAHAPAAVAARRRAIVRTLGILRPVVRPLALEITMGPLDPETFSVTHELTRRLASRAIPAQVSHQSAFAVSPEPELVDSLTPDVVWRALMPAEHDRDLHTVSAPVTG